MQTELNYLLIIFLLIDLSTQSLHEDIFEQMNNTHEVTLSRKRRYLTFPKGSSLQLVYCMTVPMIAVGQIFTVGSTAALAWELPSTVEDILILDGKRKVTTTTSTEAPSTSLPFLIHDEHHDFKRIDKPSKYVSNSGILQNQYVAPIKSYYQPFGFKKEPSYKFTPIIRENGRIYPETERYSGKQRDDKYILRTGYGHPLHEVHRRSRRDLYEKIEKLFTALNKDGKTCLHKAICEVSQVPEGKGTLIQEIIKAVFRIKPHENYPEEDHYDSAANKEHNCDKNYPTCNHSVWTDMF